MRRDLVAIAVIAAAAFAIRVYPAWQGVFGSGEVNFLETDAWYHLRLTENQVRNFPWRVTVDPYAALGGQFVPIAPLYDTIAATVVVLLYGRDADLPSVARTSAFVPPVLGTLAIIAIWALGRRVFDRRAGLVGAALLTVLPGHFMDRTLLGFVDHHALEALLAVMTLLTLVWTFRPVRESVTSRVAGRSRAWAEIAAGGALGLYLLAWGSGALLVAILGAWLVLLIPLARSADVVRAAARTLAVAAAVALVLVGLFQDPRMFRYGSQVVALVGLAAVALAAALTSTRMTWASPRSEERPRRRRTTAAIGSVVLAAAISGVAVWWLNPALLRQMAADLARLTPDSTRMGVLEARPLFWYPGEWNWLQPWQFFRSGFYIGLIALVPLTVRISRERRPPDVLVWVFTVATFAATIGQNRFGYYMVPACALTGGWLAARILDWGERSGADMAPSWSGWRLALRRESTRLFVATAIVVPSAAPALLLMPRGGTLTPYWRDTMAWLAEHTPPPFAPDGDRYYLAHYGREPARTADYTVMNWWDQGYYLIQRARRVPVANPTQARASNAARFYTETDEAGALVALRQERARFAIADWELPFRFTRDRTVAGRFQTLVEWSGRPPATYYEIGYRRTPDAWTPVWLFYEPYYRSMAYRLAVLGGSAAHPAHATSVVTLVDRSDERGLYFREILTEATYPTYDAAVQAAAASTAPLTAIVGLDPWQSAFPLAALRSFVEVYAARTPEQKPSEAPWVRVFDVR